MDLIITEDCKKILIETVLEVKKRADTQWDNGFGKKKNLKWADLKKKLLPELLPLNYNVDFACGQTNLPTRKGYCSIGFFRNDLDEEFYPKKIGQGFYIWLGYFFKTQHFTLGFGYGDYYDDQNDETIAIQEIDKNKEKFSYKYDNFNELTDNFIKDLQDMMSFFNSFNVNDFYPNSYFQKEQVSIDDLAIKLQEMYQNAEDKVLSIFLFGIENWKIIKHNGFACKDIVLKAQLPESYKTELQKAIKLGEHFYFYTPKDENKIFEPLLAQHYPSKYPLNQILYGSPGTGKTYNTIDKALEILGVNTKSKSRQELKTLFEDYKSKGQIEFVTFHQNYGYEEFVEGIKPKLDNGKKDDKIEYEIKNGIFKQLCTTNYQVIKALEEHKENKVWKVSLGEKKYHDNLRANESDYLWSYCRTHNEIRIGWTKEEKNSSIANFENEIKVGDIVCIFDSTKTIKAIGIVTSEASYNEKEPNGYENTHLQYFKRVRKVKWIYEGILEIQNGNRQLDQNTVYQLDEVSIPYLIEQISKTESKPRILIIDEINRGNISKIFGELITLIEPSKRIGKDEELRVTLPYSQESFGVPSNLYIIGTMNTADRSITSLDTALRRRFEFVEMMPDATKLGTFVSQGKTIDLQKMLTAINERIEFLYDREKTIGHAYLLDIKNLDDLKEAFQNKIIPLLQEYFYNDYEAIQAVLNDNGMVIPKQANKQKEQSGFLASNGFKNLVNDRGLEEKRIFKIAPKDSLNENGEKLWDDPQTYINIYEG